MIRFQLVSADGTKFDDEAYEVLIPTQAGAIAVFENHMPIISAAAPGVLAVRKRPSDSDDHMEQFAVSGGVVQVDGTIIRFISDDVTTPDDISEQEARAAHARAEELLANAKSLVAVDEAKRALQHRSAQLHVARLKRRHP